MAATIPEIARLNGQHKAGCFRGMKKDTPSGTIPARDILLRVKATMDKVSGTHVKDVRIRNPFVQRQDNRGVVAVWQMNDKKFRMSPVVDTDGKRKWGNSYG